MRISYDWLKDYFDALLPPPEEIARALTFHAFQVEGFEGVGDDVVFDIDVLPNRASDCLSHRGVAKEVGAALKTPMGNDSLSRPADLSPLAPSLSVSVEDTERCKRYSAALVRGVRVGPPPVWLSKRLEAIGQRSVNNVVDATNYVMFSLGQPLHAFDAARLTRGPLSPHIIVRTAKEGEAIETLDKEAYTLRSTDLVIADANGAVLGIAGVKGGSAARIDESTTDIVIESANFDGPSIRKTSRELKLFTDASRRFESRLSPELTAYALRDVVELILNIAGGNLEGYADVYPRPRGARRVGISLSEVNGLLGTSFTQADVSTALHRLGFPFEVARPIDRVVALAPTFAGAPYRYGASVTYDAPRAFDCSGFAAYLFRQAGVTIPRMTADQFVFGDEVKEVDLSPGDMVFSKAAGREGETEEFLKDGVKVSQPVLHAASREFMPGTPVPGGVSHCGVYLGNGNVIHAAGGAVGNVVVEDLTASESFKNRVGYRRMTGNEERFVVTVPFERSDIVIPADLAEEIGRTIGYENVPETALPPAPPAEVNKKFAYAENIRRALVDAGFSEVYTYTFRPAGKVAVANPVASDRPYLRVSLADGLKESVSANLRNADLLGLAEIREFEIGTVFTPEEKTTLAVGVAAGRGRKTADSIGEAKTIIERAAGIPLAGFLMNEEEGVFEIDFDALVSAAPEIAGYEPVPAAKPVAFRPISAYPFVLRDIALWVPEGTAAEEPRAVIEREAGDLLVRITPFDTFTKDGKISYAFRLVFQSSEKTLSDAEINAIMERVTSALHAREGWQVR